MYTLSITSALCDYLSNKVGLQGKQSGSKLSANQIFCLTIIFLKQIQSTLACEYNSSKGQLQHTTPLLAPLSVNLRLLFMMIKCSSG